MKFEIDSTRGEVAIESQIAAEYTPLTDVKFSTSEADIKLALELMEDLYKKVMYFYATFDLFPALTADNLLVTAKKKEIAIRKVGTMLCPTHIMKHEKVRNGEKEGVPKLLAVLLKELIFGGNTKEIDVFLKSTTAKIGMDLVFGTFH